MFVYAHGRRDILHSYRFDFSPLHTNISSITDLWNELQIPFDCMRSRARVCCYYYDDKNRNIYYYHYYSSRGLTDVWILYTIWVFFPFYKICPVSEMYRTLITVIIIIPPRVKRERKSKRERERKSEKKCEIQYLRTCIIQYFENSSWSFELSHICFSYGA